MTKRFGWLLGLTLLCGCERGFFHATGAVSSTGGRLGDWSSTPRACTRDSVLGPLEGLPRENPRRTVLTLLWQDEFAATEHPNQSRMQGPEKPLRLAIVQQGDVYQGTLSTRRLPWGVGFDSSACRVFEVDGREIPLHVPGGGPAMRGSVALDCQVGDRHVVAAVDFRNCAF